MGSKSPSRIGALVLQRRCAHGASAQCIADEVQLIIEGAAQITALAVVLRTGDGTRTQQLDAAPAQAAGDIDVLAGGELAVATDGLIEAARDQQPLVAARQTQGRA